MLDCGVPFLNPGSLSLRFATFGHTGRSRQLWSHPIMPIGLLPGRTRLRNGSPKSGLQAQMKRVTLHSQPHSLANNAGLEVVRANGPALTLSTRLSGLPRSSQDVNLHRCGFHGLCYKYIVNALYKNCADVESERIALMSMGALRRAGRAELPSVPLGSVATRRVSQVRGRAGGVFLLPPTAVSVVTDRESEPAFARNAAISEHSGRLARSCITIRDFMTMVWSATEQTDTCRKDTKRG
jgi:hypothetical protein